MNNTLKNYSLSITTNNLSYLLMVFSFPDDYFTGRSSLISSVQNANNAYLRKPYFKQTKIKAWFLIIYLNKIILSCLNSLKNAQKRGKYYLLRSSTDSKKHNQRGPTRVNRRSLFLCFVMILNSILWGFPYMNLSHISYTLFLFYHST